MTEDRKIIYYRGLAKDLPTALDTAQIAIAIDSGDILIGADPKYGSPLYNRAEYPFQNIEILTEKSTDTFSRLHSERMREGDIRDYFQARLESDTLQWTDVIEITSENAQVFKLSISYGLTAFIDYVACMNDTGEPVRCGRLTVSKAHYDDDISVSDESIQSRDLTLVGPNVFSPNDLSRVSLRLIVDPLNSSMAKLQYRNFSFSPIALSFKTSTPSENYIEAAYGIIRSYIFFGMISGLRYEGALLQTEQDDDLQATAIMHSPNSGNINVTERNDILYAASRILATFDGPMITAVSEDRSSTPNYGVNAGVWIGDLSVIDNSFPDVVVGVRNKGIDTAVVGGSHSAPDVFGTTDNKATGIIGTPLRMRISFVSGASESWNAMNIDQTRVTGSYTPGTWRTYAPGTAISVAIGKSNPIVGSFVDGSATILVEFDMGNETILSGNINLYYACSDGTTEL